MAGKLLDLELEMGDQRFRAGIHRLGASRSPSAEAERMMDRDDFMQVGNRFLQLSRRNSVCTACRHRAVSYRLIRSIGKLLRLHNRKKIVAGFG